MKARRKKQNPMFRLMVELILLTALSFGLKHLADLVVYVDDTCSYQVKR